MERGANSVKKVIMFTTQTWPHCRTAKVYLRDKGIDYEEKDVNVDAAARDEFLKRGLRGVPSFLIGDEVVVGLDKGKIEELLGL